VYVGNCVNYLLLLESRSFIRIIILNSHLVVNTIDAISLLVSLLTAFIFALYSVLGNNPFLVKCGNFDVDLLPCKMNIKGINTY